MTDDSQLDKTGQWNLLITNGAAVLETYPIAKDVTTIGRDLDNDILLDHMQISRHHARLNRRAEFLLIEDLQSANGTLLNGETLETPQAVKHGDVIELGPFSITVETVGHRERENTEQALVAPPVAPAATAPSPRRWVVPLLLLLAVLLLGVILLLSSVLAGRWLFQTTSTAGTAQTTPLTALAAPQIVINQAPAQNSEVMLNRSVTIQATAFAAGGVTRLELWANDQPVDFVESPLNQSAASMTATFEWVAAAPGPHTLEIHATTEDGKVAVAQVGRVSVIGGTETPTATVLPLLVETATPTITPLPPSPTPTFTPPPTATSLPATATPSPAPAASLTVNAVLLNVRGGPGTQYAVVGGLPRGSTATVVGQATAADGVWWQIEYPAAPGGVGWVSGNPAFVAAQNTAGVPVTAASQPATATATPPPTAAPTATPSPTATTPPAQVIRAPQGKTLLLVENRSLANQPALLTLSGGKSVGGGQQIDSPAGGQVQLVLEPDFYRALWSAPANNFARGEDFAAPPGKVLVMWIVPEDGITQLEQYDEIVLDAPPAPTASAPVATPSPPQTGPVAPPGKALLVLANRSVLNEYGQVTISGGSFGGGQLFVVNAATEQQVEMLPGDYRTVWYAPARGGVSAGREFTARAGDVIYAWIVPEDRTVFMQFPGQPEIQINN
ncbi:MAG: hypothetical protein Kow0031_07500 [Anaerolineae bacterium]